MFGRKFNPFNDYTSSQPLEAISELEWSKLQDRMMDVVYPAIADRIAVYKESMVSRLRSRPSISFRKGDIVMLRRSESIMGQPLGKFEAQYNRPLSNSVKGEKWGYHPYHTKWHPASTSRSSPYAEVRVSRSSSDFNRIIAHKGEGPDDPNIKYLVHWEGYSSKDDTWEPVDIGIGRAKLLLRYVHSPELVGLA